MKIMVSSWCEYWFLYKKNEEGISQSGDLASHVLVLGDCVKFKHFFL